MLFTSTINDIRALIWPRSLLQPLCLCLVNINPKTTGHNPLELLLQLLQAGNSLSASGANLQITLQFLEFTSWHPWKIAFGIQWYSLMNQAGLKNVHTDLPCLYMKLHSASLPLEIQPLRAHTCSRITDYVIPTALRRNRIWKGIIFVYAMLPFPVWESLSGVSYPITQMLSGVAGLV